MSWPLDDPSGVQSTESLAGWRSRVAAYAAANPTLVTPGASR
jgi:hypothetical protein